MFQARAAGEQIVGDVQHVVRLVIRHVNFQQMQIAVDGFGQPQLLGDQMHRPHAAGGDSAGAVGDLVVDIRGREHRLPATAVVVLVQPPLDATLALSQLLSYFVVHSKTLRAVFMERQHPPLNTPKRREFSGFLRAPEKISLRVRLVRN